MLDINSPVQWQQIDEIYPTFKPWFTAGMLDEIKTWDLKDKTVLEFGGGWSSIFWAYHCKKVVCIETDEKWIKDIQEYADSKGITNLVLIHRPVNEGDQSKVDYYTEIPNGYNFDIVVDDSILRHEVLLKSLTMPRPLTIIHDNWRQDGFICPASEKVMEQYSEQGKVFIEEAHTDNHGNKWSTATWNLS